VEMVEDDGVRYLHTSKSEREDMIARVSTMGKERNTHQSRINHFK
jgi:hypothetical protein